MNEFHEANRRHWDATAQTWQQLRDGDQLWRNCCQNPSLAFAGTALEMVNEFFGDLHGKQVCVIGSGDNYAAFALAGLGATVTSTDISQAQLEVASQRAQILGLDMQFVRCDAAGLAPLSDSVFDLMVSTNGFFVWIADPAAVFTAVHRVLKPGGYYIFYDIHPFMRPWKDQISIEMEKPYFSTGPFASGSPGQITYEFNWTLGDIINPLLKSGLALHQMAETPAKDSRFWQDYSYQPGSNDSLLDWRTNPRAGLPVWLTLAAQKPSATSAETRQALEDALARKNLHKAENVDALFDELEA